MGRSAKLEEKKRAVTLGERFSSPFVLCGIFALAAAIFFWSPLAAFVFLAIFPAVEDGMTGYVSDHWSFLLALGGLWHDIFYGRLHEGALSAVFILGLFCVLYFCAPNAMGAGDIFFSGAAALWLVPMTAPLFLFLASFTAALAGCALLVFGKRKRKDGIPFCPFIALGGAAAYGAEDFWICFLTSWIYFN